jgi:hypothetical protein
MLKEWNENNERETKLRRKTILPLPYYKNPS